MSPILVLTSEQHLLQRFWSYCIVLLLKAQAKGLGEKKAHDQFQE